MTSESDIKYETAERKRMDSIWWSGVLIWIGLAMDPPTGRSDMTSESGIRPAEPVGLGLDLDGDLLTRGAGKLR
jgi:hypothetical protein